MCKEIKSHEIRVLKKLRKKLYDNFGNINNGGCGVIARVLNEIFKTNQFLYVFETDSFDQDPPVHIYFKVMKNIYVDICGFVSKKEIKKIYCREYLFLESDEALLDLYYDQLGEGVKDCFVSITKMFIN